jgi:hypothetical protein
MGLSGIVVHLETARRKEDPDGAVVGKMKEKGAVLVAMGIHSERSVEDSRM